MKLIILFVFLSAVNFCSTGENETGFWLIKMSGSEEKLPWKQPVSNEDFRVTSKKEHLILETPYILKVTWYLNSLDAIA